MPDDRIRPEDIPGDMRGNMDLIRQCVEQAEEAPPAAPPEDERRSPTGEMPWQPDPAAAYAAMGGRWPGEPDDGVNPYDPSTYLRPGADGGMARPTPKPPNWPEVSPVVPLGKSGNTHYYLDALGQIQDYKPNDHGRLGLISLFSPYAQVLDNWWPKYRVAKKGTDDQEPLLEWSGCNHEVAQVDLMAACARRGVWTPFDRVRGIGAWIGENNELILHCGDTVWHGPSEGADGEWRKPGPIGQHVYAAGEPQPRPKIEDRDPADLTWAARELEGVLQSWNWQRDGDWQLLLGWIGTAMVCGALEWRPAVWLTGDAGTGKSTLQKLVLGLLGRLLVKSSDATGAGVWQVVGLSSRPVAIDELEPGDNPARTNQVISLARQAASGDVILRGGQDHQGHQFRASSAFLFSSILVPPVTPADRSRLAILELEPLAVGADVPDLTPRRLSEWGAAMQARLALRWGRVRETVDLFRRGLAQQGHANRGADQFGTLLAMAYILRSDEALTPETVAEICKPYAADARAETAGRLADWQEMLAHMLSKRTDIHMGGRRQSIGRLVELASSDDPHDRDDARSANEGLQTFGLKLIKRQDVKYDLPEDKVLAVATRDHSGLAEIFEGKRWAAGVWEQSVGRVPGRMKAPNPVRIAGQQQRGVWLLPLSTVLDPSGVSPTNDDRTEDARRAAAVLSAGDGTASDASETYGPPDDAAYPHASGWGDGPPIPDPPDIDPDPWGMEDEP